MKRPEYQVNLTINQRRIIKVVIDQHYTAKHAHLTDAMILEMVRQLDGQIFPVEERHGEFRYFRVEPVFYDDRPHRLILLLSTEDDYLGVVNAFRVPRRKR